MVLGFSTTRGPRFFPPSSRLELLLGRVRRWLGRHRRVMSSVRSFWTPSQGEFSINLREHPGGRSADLEEAMKKLDHRSKQHTQFGVSASKGSRDMAQTKSWWKKKEKI